MKYTTAQVGNYEEINYINGDIIILWASSI